MTKRSRTQCQYCRLQKCIAVGMKAHGKLIIVRNENLRSNKMNTFSKKQLVQKQKIFIKIFHVLFVTHQHPVFILVLLHVKLVKYENRKICFSFFLTVKLIIIKGFFRRSIKENAPERYHCTENNNCEIIAASKITCRACRFRKCIEAGMSMNGEINFMIKTKFMVADF